MRDIVWLIADLECQATIKGFLERPDFHLSLECSTFRFSMQDDLLRDAQGKDPGVWRRAHEFLRGKQYTHRHAVIILDNAWDGSPGPTRIEANITRNMVSCGWNRTRFEVIVINPELEAWIWQDSPDVEEAFGHVRPPSLREKLATVRHKASGQALWPPGEAKPPDPKAAVETVLSMYRLGPASPVFNEIASKVSVGQCQDPAFQKLRAALQRWFSVDNS
ncbi:MAG: hypothetical protein A2156_08510 [Deltaproteobacteria bacterium RBG_16_48_10]|nr:MAG: hypothetical protein A2156_08510 [Deltaproteobacteria bacterium RBG_16_48_10]